MLYIGALCFNKMATLYFVATLARTDTSRAAIRGSMAVTTVWAVTAIFGIAFQCQPPQTWAIATGKCFNQVSSWISHAIWWLTSARVRSGMLLARSISLSTRSSSGYRSLSSGTCRWRGVVKPPSWPPSFRALCKLDYLPHFEAKQRLTFGLKDHSTNHSTPGLHLLRQGLLGSSIRRLQHRYSHASWHALGHYSYVLPVLEDVHGSRPARRLYE